MNLVIIMTINYQNIIKQEDLMNEETFKEYQNIKYICNQIHLSYHNSRDSRSIIPTPKDLFLKAQKMIKAQNQCYQNMNYCVDTMTKKWLLLTNMTFPNDQKFIDNLRLYGVETEKCLDFSEEIRGLGFYSQYIEERLELLIIEYFETLPEIKQHYGIHNTAVIINKILEIAYLHPELLQSKKEKS